MSDHDDRLNAIKKDFSKTLPVGYPLSLLGWSIDECIECLSLGANRPLVTAALLVLRPLAYERRAPLSIVWSELRVEVQDALRAAGDYVPPQEP